MVREFHRYCCNLVRPCASLERGEADAVRRMNAEIRFEDLRAERPLTRSFLTLQEYDTSWYKSDLGKAANLAKRLQGLEIPP